MPTSDFSLEICSEEWAGFNDVSRPNRQLQRVTKNLQFLVEKKDVGAKC